MNIIIVGGGKIGHKLCEQLSNEKNCDITIIDLKEKIVNELVNRYDIIGVTGSGSDINTLLEADINDADILIAVTGSDELNMLTCLMAKKLGNCQTVARIKKPEFGRAAGLIKDDLGLAMVINPEKTAAKEISRILKFPTAIQIDTFSKGKIEILKYRIPDNSVISEMKIADIRNQLNCDILVCGVERGDDVFIPGGDFVLKSGDYISFIASSKNGLHFFKTIGTKTRNIKNVFIVGGGPTSYYLAEYLEDSSIRKIKIIEKDPARCEHLCQLLPKAEIINGDGTDNRILLEEGIEFADSFVALTNIDEENILLSLYVKSKINGKLVTKINRIDYDKIVNKLDIGTTVCPKDIAAEYILKFVRGKLNSRGDNIETMRLLLNGKAEAIEFTVTAPSQITKKDIGDLNLKYNTLIACINRKGNIKIPRGNDRIFLGDNVVIVTANKGYKDISDILK